MTVYFGVGSHLGGGESMLVMTVAGERNSVSLCHIFAYLTSRFDVFLIGFNLAAYFKAT